MNGPTRKKLYESIVKRDGEQCAKCGRKPPEVQLIIEHKDNNPKNNSPENIRLYCRRCNYFKNPRRPLHQRVRSPRNDTYTTQLERNHKKEEDFRKHVTHEVNEHRQVPEKELIDGGAEKVGISPITAKRYLDKMCSKYGVFMRKTIGKTTVIQYKNELP